MDKRSPTAERHAALVRTALLQTAPLGMPLLELAAVCGLSRRQTRRGISILKDVCAQNERPPLVCTIRNNLVWWHYGPHHPKTQKSVEGINQLHAFHAKRYPGNFAHQEDHVYTLALARSSSPRVRSRRPGTTAVASRSSAEAVIVVPAQHASSAHHHEPSNQDPDHTRASRPQLVAIGAVFAGQTASEPFTTSRRS
ncbi:hypothetical protein [Streptomyces qaidamensis]|uniref:hypothetical protein n=1 Tax=Streptomyces qaidamensis TaxID=1783515 RepID=UPI00131E0D37|nr:hypothetical protein [Streptomyces qaidamensis]